MFAGIPDTPIAKYSCDDIPNIAVKNKIKYNTVVGLYRYIMFILLKSHESNKGISIPAFFLSFLITFLFCLNSRVKSCFVFKPVKAMDPPTQWPKNVLMRKFLLQMPRRLLKLMCGNNFPFPI